MEKQILSRYDYLWKIYLNIQENIRSLDNKVFIQMIISGMIVSYVIATFSNTTPETSQSQVQITAHYICIIYLFIFSAFILISILVLLPRKMIKVYPQEHFIFYEGIASRPEFQRYLTEFIKATDDELIRDLSSQIYAISKIARLKLQLAAISFYLLSLQILIFSFLILSKTL